MSEERRQRFFRPVQAGYAVSVEVRELCTFSIHNLLRDPPLSRMDMVSCRNLLIYLDTQAQEAVIPVFHYALNDNGILLLGGSESVARHANLFDPLDRTSRIFVKRNVKSPSLHLQVSEIDGSVALNPAGNLPAGASATLGRLSAPNFHDAERLAQRAGAEPALPETAQAPDQAPLPLRPFFALWRWLCQRSQSYQQLQLKVASTQEELLSLAEEYQTALEDLRSANEELHSVNEEMQSTNEEMETSKEELQSVNEELNTVNARLSEKVDELDAANNDLRNLFASTGVATIFLDRELVIRSFTPAVAALYKLIPSDQGRPLTDIVGRLQYTSLQADVTEVLQTLKPLERRIAHEDNRQHFIMRILPYRAPDNSVSGALITFIDVTSLVQAESRLREADARKDVFIATLSHELRNPLAPIRTAALLLASPKLEADQAEQLRSLIARQVLHMSSLLDDLFDLSRISRNTFQLKKEVVPWSTVLNAALETVRSQLDVKCHKLDVQAFDDRLRLEVDPVRLTQILSNLLTNAVKFTPEGGVIKVCCSVQGHDFKLSVQDNGMGIAPTRIDQVFGMFTRGDDASSLDETGLGIGLALVQGLVELHGGQVQVHSPGLGQGCIFEVMLPGAVVNQPAAKTQSTAAGPSQQVVKRRVLIADDNQDGALTLATYLRLEGHEVLVAHTGVQALEMATEHRPQVCVLDIGMPGLTGLEVAERIRREPWGRRMMLVAVTGWGQEKDKAASRASGFDHHLTKPIDPRSLSQLLSEVS